MNRKYVIVTICLSVHLSVCHAYDLFQLNGSSALLDKRLTYKLCCKGAVSHRPQSFWLLVLVRGLIS